MLTKSGEFNDLSTQLQDIIRAKISQFGKKVKVKFRIAQKNPEHNFIGSAQAIESEVDLSQVGGPKFIYPAYWDLQPVTYRIVDPGDKKRKRIGLVKEENEKGHPVAFHRITLVERDRGVRQFDTDRPDEHDALIYLLLHPAHKGGMFHDDEYGDMFEIINEVADAKTRNRRRSDKADAMYVAANMSEKEIKDFACAIGWDENDEPELLADQIANMAESDHEGFKRFLEDSHYAYRAEIKRAENAGVIIWSPMENKYTWSNGQTIAAFGIQENLDRLKALSEFLESHKEGDAMFKRIKALLRPKRESKEEVPAT